MVTNQLGVPGLLARPGNCEARTADSRCSRFTFSGQRANQRSSAPPSKSSPSTTTSNLLVSKRLIAPRSMTRTKTFVRRAAAFSRREPRRPSRLQQNTPTDGGQGRRKDGHICKRELRVGVGDGGGTNPASHKCCVQELIAPTLGASCRLHHHLNGVSPAGPMGGLAQPQSTPQPQTCRKRRTCGCSDAGCWSSWCHTHEFTETGVCYLGQVSLRPDLSTKTLYVTRPIF